MAVFYICTLLFNLLNCFIEEHGSLAPRFFSRRYMQLQKIVATHGHGNSCTVEPNIVKD